METLTTSVKHNDHDTFSFTLSKMTHKDFVRKPSVTLIPLLTDEFINTCDANAANIAKNLVRLEFTKGYKLSAQILEKLFIRHNTLTREVVPPTVLDWPSQNTITHKQHALAMTAMATAEFNRNTLMYWNGEPKVYGWLASCLQSGIDGRDLSYFLSSMVTIGKQIHSKLCDSFIDHVVFKLLRL
jgi:hypothetical protein